MTDLYIDGTRSQSDLYLSIAMGMIPGYSVVSKFGHNEDVDSGTDEDVWMYGGDWTPPTTARLHNIRSDNAADDIAGTGAQKVTIEGLDSSYALQTEEVELAGVANAVTANTYTRIFRMYVSQFGSGRTNAGEIIAEAQADLSITASIEPGEGQTEMAIYTVPADHKAYMTSFFGGMDRSGGASATLDVELRIRNAIDGSNPGYRLQHVVGVQKEGTSHFQHIYNPPFEIDEKTDIVLRATNANASDNKVSAGFSLILRKL